MKANDCMSYVYNTKLIFTYCKPKEPHLKLQLLYRNILRKTSFADELLSTGQAGLPSSIANALSVLLEKF